MERCLIQETRAANLDEVRDLRKLLERVLGQEIPSPTDIQHMLLCFSELATNIVRHSQPSASQLTVSLQQSSQHWKIQIEDNGGSWQTNEAPDLDASALTDTNGRGLALIAHYVDHQSYTPGETNETQLCWDKANLGNQKKTLLLVEDDPSQQRLYQAFLNKDYQVLIADNGTAALSLLEQHSVDLILSDINMPGMNGLALRDKLNTLARYQRIPFIFMTHGTDLVSQTSELGIDDFLAKPVTKQQLQTSIERVLNRSHQLAAALSDQINEKISATLQPKLPGCSGKWRIAYGRRTTGVGGGDFILTEFGRQGLSLMLVDILGHSIESKFFSYAYAGYLRGFLNQQDHTAAEPAGLITKISAAAANDELLSQTLMTCVLCNLTDDAAYLCSAGHPPALIVSKNHISVCDAGGPLPGLLPDARFPQQRVCLPPGQRLVLYTDGLMESGGSNERRKHLENVIKKTLKDTLSTEIEQACLLTMQAFDRHAGTPPEDDATLILLEQTH